MYVCVCTCVSLCMGECVYSMYTDVRHFVGVGDLTGVLDLAASTITIKSSQ